MSRNPSRSQSPALLRYPNEGPLYTSNYGPFPGSINTTSQYTPNITTSQNIGGNIVTSPRNNVHQYNFTSGEAQNNAFGGFGQTYSNNFNGQYVGQPVGGVTTVTQGPFVGGQVGGISQGTIGGVNTVGLGNNVTSVTSGPYIGGQVGAINGGFGLSSGPAFIGGGMPTQFGGGLMQSSVVGQGAGLVGVGAPYELNTSGMQANYLNSSVQALPLNTSICQQVVEPIQMVQNSLIEPRRLSVSSVTAVPTIQTGFSHQNEVIVREPIQIHTVPIMEQKAQGEDCSKYKSRILELERECESWKKKYNDKDQECVRLGKKVREVDIQNQNLEEELRRANLKIKSLNGEVEDWRTKYQRLDMQFKQEQEKNADLVRKIKQLENNVSELQSENERLKRQIREKDEEIETLQAKVRKLEQEVEEWESECTQAQRKCRELEEELEDIRSQLQQKIRIIQDLEEEINTLKRKLSECQNELQRLQSELQKCKSIIQQLESEKMQLISKIKQLEDELNNLRNQCNQFKSRIQELESKISQYEARIREFTNKIQEFERVIQTKDRRIQELEGMLRDMEQKFKMQLQQSNGELENARLGIQQREEELDKLRKVVRRYEEEISSSSQWEQKCKILSEEVQNLMQENEDLRSQMEMYKKKYIEFSGIVEKCNDTMAQYVVVCAQLEAMMMIMKSGGEQRKSRASISEQLAALGGSQSQTVTRTVREVEEFI